MNSNIFSAVGYLNGKSPRNVSPRNISSVNYKKDDDKHDLIFQ